jgi:hypothetical protein
MTTIHLPKGTAPIRLTATDAGRLTITNDNNIWLQLSDPDLPALLHQLARDLSHGPGVIQSPPLSPGKRGPGDEGQYQQFQINSDPPPNHTLTLADLQGLTLEQAYSLLIERFRHSTADIYDALLDDYKKLTGRQYSSPPPGGTEGGQIPATESTSNLTTNLARLRPHLADIIKPNGQANKSEIARLLDLPAGGSAWSYITQLAAAIELEHTKKAA